MDIEACFIRDGSAAPPPDPVDEVVVTLRLTPEHLRLLATTVSFGIPDRFRIRASDDETAWLVELRNTLHSLAGRAGA